MAQAILSCVIGAIGAQDFAAVTAGALCEFLGFERTAVFFHRRDASPVVVFDNFALGEARRGIENYIRFTHRIHPILARECPAGVFRARDFALDPHSARKDDVASYLVLTPEEELGFRTVGWPRRQEEICLYLEACHGLVEIGLYRARGRNVAPAHKVHALRALSTPIAAAFDRHEALTARVGVTALTPREREVYDLLLLGCSTEAIALRLNIGRYTVKDHRKSIFRKLRVGSLAELLARRALVH